MRLTEYASRIAFWHGFAPGLGGLPPLRALAAARVLSATLPVRPRPAVRHALGIAFPERSAPALDALAAAEARFSLRQRLEMAVFPRLDGASAERHVRLVGRAHLDRALSGGRGAVLAGAHIGVHGLPPLALARAGYPVATRTFLLPDAELSPAQAYGQRKRKALESRMGLRFIRAGEPGDDPSAPLRRGEALISTGDGLGPEQVLGEAPRVLPLLGQPVAWPEQAFRIAREAGAPVLGLFLRSEGEGHRLRITPPLGGDDPLPEFVRTYEEELRDCPEEWQFWDLFRDGALIRGY